MERSNKTKKKPTCHFNCFQCVAALPTGKLSPEKTDFQRRPPARNLSHNVLFTGMEHHKSRLLQRMLFLQDDMSADMVPAPIALQILPFFVHTVIDMLWAER